MVDFVSREKVGTLQLSAQQLASIRKVLNNTFFENNTMVIGQIYWDGKVNIRWLNKWQAIILFCVMRLIGIKKNAAEQSLHQTVGESAKILETLRNCSWKTNQVLPKPRRR